MIYFQPESRGAEWTLEGFSSAAGERTELPTFEVGSAGGTSGSTAKSNDLTEDNEAFSDK
jgi:hypothetical protein